MNRPTWYVILWLLGVGLSTCKTPADQVLPQVAQIQLVIDNARPTYFLEDSLNNTVTLKLTFYDANRSVIIPTAQAQFFVNDQLISGNTYRFTQAGQYTFSARVGERPADNRLGPLRVGPVRDFISRLRLRTLVSFVNADSTSRLPLLIEAYSPQNTSVSVGAYPLTLSVNHQPVGSLDYLSVSKPGSYTLEANLFGLSSPPITIEAQPPTSYPLVRLPVIIHLPKGTALSVIDADAILTQTNAAFRKQYVSFDPNQADSFIDFVAAKTDPDGQPLTKAGLDVLDFTNPADVQEALSRVNAVVHRWCPQRYINVLVGIDWLRAYPPGYSFSYLPDPLANLDTFDCDQLQRFQWSGTQLPAVFINNLAVFEVLAHELGHFLSLQHTFANGCLGSPQAYDVPAHQEAQPSDGVDLKRSCEGISFHSQYVMDYYVRQLSFTHGQVALMRAYLSLSGYVPTNSLSPARGYSTSRVNKLPTGRVSF